MPNASLTTVLSGVNSIGLFASRAFVSAFAIAALLKWGPQIAWIQNTGLLQHITDVPTWFTHDITVTILGLLAVLEIAATKSADARALLNEVDGYLKSGTAFVTTLTLAGIISKNDAAVIKQITAWGDAVHAGVGESALAFFTAAFSAIGVWLTCAVRARMLGVLFDADPDDDTMIGGLLSWAEDLWALLGTLMLILFPVVMLGITAVLLSGIAFLQWRAKRKEEKSKTACPTCAESMYRCAINCPNCNAANPSVHGIGWLGQSLDTRATNVDDQPNALIRKQRCPVCATYLKPRRIRQACPGCGHALFADQDRTHRYLSSIDARVPLTLAITCLLSLIPIVGLIPAIMVYRLKLIAPLRRYTSMTRTIPVRWALRILFLVLVWVQVIPGIGALAVPMMAILSYSAYRSMFLRQLERESGSADR